MARPVQQWRDVISSILDYNESCASKPDPLMLEECQQLLRRAMAATGSNWHKLILDEKTPQRLCEACCYDPSTVTVMAPVLLESLHAFIIRMLEDGLATTKKGSSLMRSIRVQLEQADFLAHLPAVTASVLADLAELPEPAAVTQQLQEPGWSWTDTPDRDLHDIDFGSSLQGAARRAFHLQQLLARVDFWWRTRDAGVSAAAVGQHTAAVQLSTAIVQWGSCCLEHLPQQQLEKPPQLITILMVGVRESVLGAAMWWNDTLESGAPCGELLHMLPHVLSAAALVLLITTYGLLLTDEDSWQQFSREEHNNMPVHAWRMASSHDDVLPASHDELLRLLGCSSKAVLYIAALRTQAGDEATSAMTRFHLVFRQAFDLLLPCSPQQLQQRGPAAASVVFSAAVQQRICALYFYLPSVLLHCAARYPSSREQFNVVLGANTMGCAVLLAQLILAQKAWTNPELLQLSTEQPCWPATGPFPSAEWLLSLHSMNHLTLTEPLSCAVAVLRGVLTQAAADPAAQGQKYYHTWHRQAVDLVEILLRWLNLLLTAADQGPSSSQVLALKQQLHAAMRQHAAELCSLLEHCCRLQTQLDFSGKIAAGWPADRGIMLFSPGLFLPGKGYAMLPRAAAAAGPGSPEEQQLWSVLASMIKYCGYSGKASSEDAYNSRCAVRHAVAVLLLGRWRTDVPGGDIDSFSSASSSSTGTSSRTAAAAGPTVQAVAAWLALCGRCLLLLSAELTQQLAVTPELMREAVGLGMQEQRALAAKAALEQRVFGSTGCLRDDDMQMLLTLLTVLQDGSMSAQLSSAGYDVQTLADSLKLAAMLASTPALAQTAGECSTASRHCIGLQHSLLIRQLQVAGFQLNGLPFSWGCNNPACSNLTGPSELQLVKGKEHSCKGCHTARYCNRVCQTAHWKQHKKACKEAARCASRSGGVH